MIEEIKKMRQTSAGCLDPNQNLIACEVYQHSTLMGVEELYQQMHEEYWEEAHRIVDEEFEAAGDGYYHPEWHRFEIGEVTRQDAMLSAYQQGWIRLIYNPIEQKLYAESVQKFLNSRKGYLEFIAECLDKDCTLHLSAQK
jgi:hypothetical protein